MKNFVGRNSEIKELEDLFNAPRPILVTIKGRRRIGKSRLVAEFSKGREFISFTGLAPIDGITAQEQRDEFARQYAARFNIPPMTFKDWSDAFSGFVANILKCVFIGSLRT